MWPGPYGEWGSRKYLLASLDQSLQRMGLDYVDIFYSHRFDPDTPLEETMGALDTAVRQGKALYAGISSYSAAAHRGGRRRSCATSARRCSSTSPPTRCSTAGSRPTCSTSSAARASGAIVFSPLAQGMLTDRYLDGIPEDSRAAARRVAVEADAQRREPRARPRAQRDRAAPRADARPARARVGAARPARDLGADRRQQRRAARGQRRRRSTRLDFDDDELAEIDKYAVDAGINIWERSSSA